MQSVERFVKRAPRGMTLLEIMVVLVIIGLIASMVAVNVVKELGKAKVKKAKTDLATFSECIDSYKIEKGHYPTTEEGLGAVISAGKCKGSLKDPWDHEYLYLSPGQAHTDSFDVKSYGADGAPGGSDENADIVNE